MANDVVAYYINEISFDNEDCLMKHLQYLFRSDPEQKWSNAKITKNCIAFPSKDNINIFNFPDDLPCRIKFTEAFSNSLMVLSSKYGLARIKSVRMDYDKELCLDDILDNCYDDIISLLDNIANTSTFPVLFVGHFDDHCYHSHLIYVSLKIGPLNLET